MGYIGNNPKAGYSSSEIDNKIDSLSQNGSPLDSRYYTEPEVDSAVASVDLSTKQDTLVSGTNIKTINGESVLGSGGVNISVGSKTFIASGTIEDGRVVVLNNDGTVSEIKDTLTGTLGIEAQSIAGGNKSGASCYAPEKNILIVVEHKSSSSYNTYCYKVNVETKALTLLSTTTSLSLDSSNNSEMFYMKATDTFILCTGVYFTVFTFNETTNLFSIGSTFTVSEIPSTTKVNYIYDETLNLVLAVGYDSTNIMNIFVTLQKSIQGLNVVRITSTTLEGNIQNVKIKSLGNGKVLMLARNLTAGVSVGYIITIDASNITLGSVNTFTGMVNSTTNIYYNSSTGKIIVGYYPNVTPYIITFYNVTVSGDIIALGYSYTSSIQAISSAVIEHIADNKYLLIFSDYSNSNYLSAVEIIDTGNTFTVGTPFILKSAPVYQYSSTLILDGSVKFLYLMYLNTADNKVYSNTYGLTSSNAYGDVIGISNSSANNAENVDIKIFGGISSKQSGLVIGDYYYNDYYGDLVNYNTGNIKVGKALSSTDLLILTEGK